MSYTTKVPMRRFSLLVVMLSLTAPAPLALAWGSDGHRAIGAIADLLIAGSNAQQHVAALLLPGESLEQVANWLDCAKGRHCGPASAEMLEFTAMHPAHARYHYTDIAFQSAHYHAGAAGSSADDIVHTLTQAIEVLQRKVEAKAKAGALSQPDLDANAAAFTADSARQFTPRQALLLVAHLVGDIHQPLHVGVAYVQRSGKFGVPHKRGGRRVDRDGAPLFDTRGGNSLLLDEAQPACPVPASALVSARAARSAGTGRPQARNFHAYWDVGSVDCVLRRAGLRTPKQLAPLLSMAIASAAGIGSNTGDPALWPQQWADASLRVAQLAYAGVAAGPIGTETGRNGEIHPVWPLSLSPGYGATSAALARQQLTAGGRHLAALLQAIWP
jgi:hypothetical protein